VLFSVAFPIAAYKSYLVTAVTNFSLRIADTPDTH
jgi:hypothetical protein